MVEPPPPTIVTFVMLGGKVPESCDDELEDSATAPATATATTTTTADSARGAWPGC
jgi:hypothetical protein